MTTKGETSFNLDSSPYGSNRALLLELEKEFGDFVSMRDMECLRVTLAAWVANCLQGDPVWLLLIGPPSSGKTEILNLLSGLENCHEVSTFTEGSLLSGSPKREIGKDATGGLLKKMGRFGIMVSKDFTTVLSMNRDTRNQALAILREAFDGRVTRILGTDGGKEILWEGKLGVIAAVTQKIDSCHSVIGSMGERFLMFRMRTDIDSSLEQARKAFLRTRDSNLVRESLREQTYELLANVDYWPECTPSIPEWFQERFVTLATVAATARTPVERDYDRSISLIPYAEGPGRIVQELKLLFQGLLLIGCTYRESWNIVKDVAFFSMPELRRRVLISIREKPACTLDDITKSTGHPRGTLNKSLEELECLRIITRGDSRKPVEWAISSEFSNLMDVLELPIPAWQGDEENFPDLSEDLLSSPHTQLTFRKCCS